MTERVKSLPELFFEREAIEDEIRSIDNMALVNYELKQLNSTPHPKDYLINLESENTQLKERVKQLEEALQDMARDYEVTALDHSGKLPKECNRILRKAKQALNTNLLNK